MSRRGDPDRIGLGNSLVAGAASTAPIDELLNCNAERVVTGGINRGSLWVHLASVGVTIPVSVSQTLAFSVNNTYPAFCAVQYFDFSTFNCRDVSYVLKVVSGQITHIRAFAEVGGPGFGYERIIPFYMTADLSHVTSDPMQWSRIINNLNATRGALRRIGFAFADESVGSSVTLHATGWREV